MGADIGLETLEQAGVGGDGGVLIGRFRPLGVVGGKGFEQEEVSHRLLAEGGEQGMAVEFEAFAGGGGGYAGIKGATAGLIGQVPERRQQEVERDGVVALREGLQRAQQERIEQIRADHEERSRRDQGRG